MIFTKREIKIPVDGITVMTGLLSLVLLTVAANWFFDNYQLRSPILVQLPWKERMNIVSAQEHEVFKSPIPVKVLTATPTITPTPTKEPKKESLNIELTPQDEKEKIVMAGKYPDRVMQIWNNESSKGRNNAGLAGYCKSIGMTNEFGFMPYSKHCFNTFQESVARVNLWFDKEASGLPIAVAMCWYSGHGQVAGCSYDTSLIAEAK